MYKHAQGWNEPKANPPISHERSPIKSPEGKKEVSPPWQPPSSTVSSSPSLRGFEQAIPSFREFVKHVPLGGSEKPLPALPTLKPRRSDSSIIDSYLRRSSSVYSRTVSQGFQDFQRSWSTDDLAETLPVLLHPAVYSASPPDITAGLVEKTLLEARTFSPLIATPSSTTSVATMHFEPTSQPEPLTLRSVISPVVPVAAYEVQTVPLEEAIQATSAPGKVPMLPEELRAEALSKMRPSEEQALGGKCVTAARRKTAEFYLLQLAQTLPHPSVPTSSVGLTHADQKAESARCSAGSISPNPDLARDRVLFSGIAGSDSAQEEEHRGRPGRAGENVITTNDAQKLACEYQSLLGQTHRDRSASSACSSVSSIRTHMKLIPQPLFQEKGSIQNRRERSHDQESHISPFHMHRRERRSNSSNSRTSKQRSVDARTGLFRDWSASSGTRASRRSSEYLISLPVDHSQNKNKSPADIPSSKREKANKYRHLHEGRISDFYPHITHRRKNSKKHERSAWESNGSRHPLLAAEIPRKQRKSSKVGLAISPPTKEMVISGEKQRNPRSSVSNPSKARLHQTPREISQKYSLPRGNDESTRPDTALGTSLTLSQSSDLPSSPTGRASPHLGWSDRTKKKFDESCAPDTRWTPRPPHALAPARSENRAKGALEEDAAEPRNPRSRRPSLFGDFSLFSWREDKSQKRREDLKRMIRVVPAEQNPAEWQPSDMLTRRPSTFSWV